MQEKFNILLVFIRDSYPETTSTTIIGSVILPAGAATGAYDLKITNPDGQSVTVSGAFTVTAPLNRPPVANAGTDQTVNVNSIVTLDGSLSSDPDSDPITYKWSILTRPPSSSAIFSDTTAKKPTFTVDKAGDYPINLLVNDGYIDSAPATVAIHSTQSGLTVPVDIEPGLCPNLIGINMKGPILIVAISGTKDLDAKKIDPATITLSREGIPGGVNPCLSKIIDIATPYSGSTICSCQRKLWDGTKDLALVFDVAEVVTKLQLKGITGQTIPFVIKGSLKTEYGKTPLSGSDCIKVLPICNEKIWQNI